MERLCQEVARLTQANKVAQPEQVVFQALISLDAILEAPLSEDNLSRLEKAVVSLAKINGGKFSVQCAIFIADCLVKVYRKMEQPPLVVTVANLLAQFQASAIIVGRLCEEFGEKVASQFPKVVEAALVLPESMIYEALYALQGVFRHSCSNFGPQMVAIWKLLKKHVESPPESVQLIALKVLKNIVKCDASYVHNVIECLDLCAGKQQVPFVRFRISNVLAACAVRSNYAVNMLKRYPELAGHAVQRYMEVVPYQKVVEQYQAIFEVIKQCCPEYIVELVGYLPAAGKQSLFNHALSQNPPSISQVTMLILLAKSEENSHSAAGAALQLGRSMEQKDRDYCSFFFEGVARRYPNTAASYLSNAVQVLTTDKFEVYSLAYGTVAMAILETDPASCAVVGTSFQNLVDAISPCSVDSPRFAAMLGISAFLPETCFKREQMEANLMKVKTGIAKILNSKDPIDGKLMNTIENALLFYSKRPGFSGADVMLDRATTLLEKLSDRALMYFVDLIIASKRNCEAILPALVERAMSVFPGRGFCKSHIERVVLTADDILQAKRETDNFVSSRQKYGQQLISKFPDLLELCSAGYQEKTITDMLVQPTSVANRRLVLHSMIFMVVMSNKIPLPKQFRGNLLKSLSGSDYLRIQLTCEVVALLLERNNNLIDPLFRFIELNKRAVSCLLLSAIMCRVHLPSQYLSRALLFLDERLYCHYSAPFALHAISTALTTHQEDIKQLQLGGHHLSLILGLLNGATSLHPVVLYHQSNVFSDLIPVANEADGVFIHSILNTIRSTPYSLAKGICYNCITSISFQFPQLARSLWAKWPSKGCPFPLLLSAAEAYLAVGRIPDLSVLERLLLCLQKTEDARGINCVAALLTNIEMQRLLQFVNNVFMTNIISDNIPIEPCFEVKLAVMKALSTRCSAVSQQDAFSVALCCCSAASSGYKELQLLAFPCLQLLIHNYQLASLAPHFSALSEVALNLDLSVTGGFLASFISPSNIEICLASLLSTSNITNEYLIIAARVIKIAAENGKKDQLVPFVSSIYPRYEAMVKKSMESYGCEELRLFYRYLHAAFVILMSVSGTQPIPIEKLFAFYVVEMKSTPMSWVAQGDINGAAAVLEFFAGDVETAMISELLDVVISNASTTKTDAQEEIISLMSVASARDGLSEACWNNILSSVITIGLRGDTLARVLLHFDSQTLTSHLEELSMSLLNAHDIDDERRIALFNILGSKVGDKKGNLINLVIDWANTGANRSTLAFKILNVVVAQSPACDFDKLSDFVARRLRRGGIQFAGSLLLNDLEKGVQVAVRGVLRECVALLLSDHENAELYISYLHLALDKAGSVKLTESLRKGLLKYVMPNQMCCGVLREVVALIREWKSEDCEALCSFYESLEDCDREKCMSILSMN